MLRFSYTWVYCWARLNNLSHFCRHVRLVIKLIMYRIQIYHIPYTIVIIELLFTTLLFYRSQWRLPLIWSGNSWLKLSAWFSEQEVRPDLPFEPFFPKWVRISEFPACRECSISGAALPLTFTGIQKHIKKNPRCCISAACCNERWHVYLSAYLIGGHCTQYFCKHFSKGTDFYACGALACSGPLIKLWARSAATSCYLLCFA